VFYEPELPGLFLVSEFSVKTSAQRARPRQITFSRTSLHPHSGVNQPVRFRPPNRFQSAPPCL